MKTINQLIDIAQQTPSPRAKSIINLLNKLSVLKMKNGGRCKVENSEDILRSIITETAKNGHIIPNLENR